MCSCNFINEFQAIMSKIIYYIYDNNIKNKILSDIIFDYYKINSELYINFINIENKYVENFEMSISNEYDFNICNDIPECQSQRNKRQLSLKM